ncbi:MAG: ATP-dependent helicase [Candidatus Latescibacteria bacterium]|nr:ATP-dependent helicase [Candidatus Latescibacterota bacterium]
MKTYTLKPSGVKRLAYTEHLNPPQLAAVTAGPGPKLVIAGAGTGKTMTITYRVAYLLDHGVLPEQTLLLTFTNKAAQEMINRVAAVTGMHPGRFWAGTFHSIANRILRREAELIGYRQNYTILDQEDAKDLIDRCISMNQIDTKVRRFPSAGVLNDLFSYAVNTRSSLEDAISVKAPYCFSVIDEVGGVQETYRRLKQETHVMDYDDLLINLLKLLKEHDEVRIRYASQFEHVLVDEYQDTNLPQAEIVRLLSSVHGNLTVVGDDAQSIYRFRGATDVNILEFSDHYEGAERFTLDINYRSTPQILHLANQVIERGTRRYKKELRAVKGAGSLPTVIPLRDPDEQATFVCQRILELRDEGIPMSEIGVLYRAHYQSMELQVEMTRRGIPYVVRSGVRFFEQAHIKDVIAYLRVLHNPFDEMAWRRLMQMLPGIGRATAGSIWAELSGMEDPMGAVKEEAVRKRLPSRAKEGWNRFVNVLHDLQEMAQAGEVGRLIGHVIEGDYGLYLQTAFDNYEMRLEDLQQLALYAERFHALGEFLSELSLVGGLSAEDIVSGDIPDERVVLSSIHQAKGLEWTVVFAIYLADGKFPAAAALREVYGEEEERRLFYVAATRARQDLYLTYPLLAIERGGATLMKPSRFLSELDQECYEVWTVRV